MSFSKLSQVKVKKKPKKRKPISIGKLKKKIETKAKLRAKERDNYICQRCDKKVEGSNAHGSHVIPVSASQLLRFDLKNIKTLCFHCHINWWHKNPLEADEWFMTKFLDRYVYLIKHRHDVKKWKRSELEELYASL